MKRSRTSTDLTDRLAALSEPVRLRVCRLLEREELSVGEVSKIVQMPQSTVSRHLKLLTEAGWTRKRAEGTATLYRLTLDDLPEPSRRLWVTVREEVEDDAHAADDDHRLRAARRSASPSTRCRA
jgi:DNA-binding transcriptional ArsR family regulator